MVRAWVVAIAVFAALSAAAPIRAAAPRPGSPDAALLMPDGPVHIVLGIVQSASGDWLFLSRAGKPLPVYAPGADPAPVVGNSLRIDGQLYTSGLVRAVKAAKMSIYTDGRTGAPTAPPPDPANWPHLREVQLSSSAAESFPAPPALDETESGARLSAQTGTVADARINGGQVSLEGVIVIGVYDPDGFGSNGFFYIQDINTGSGSPMQVPCGIKVVPDDPGLTATLKPGDIVDVSGTVVASSSTVAECYIDADDVDIVSNATPVAPFFTPNRVLAGGEMGLQQALYMKTPAANQAVGVGLNPVGTLVRTTGRILWIELEEDKVVYWLDDGSGLERTVIEDEEPVVRKGLKVIAWTDAATPVRYEEDLTKKDYVSFAGVVGAEFSEDDTPLPAPVLLVGRKNLKRIVYVNGDIGDDSNAGDGWGMLDAKATVQGGINAAGEDDEVWVAARAIGTYTKRAGDANVAVLSGGVAVYGGFSGSEQYRWQRDPELYPTVLDGQALYPVAVVQNLGRMCRIDSLTIQNGNADWQQGGGGIRAGSSEAVISNNTITGNEAYGNFGAGIACIQSPCLVVGNAVVGNGIYSSQDGGGGIYCDSYPSAYVARNTISGNEGSYGGGIGLSGAKPVIRNNEITANYSVIFGGGVYSCAADVRLFANEITGNVSASGGAGIYLGGGSEAVISGNLFDTNTAGETGGAAYLAYTSCRVIDNAFTDNTAGIGGGAIWTMGTGVDDPVTPEITSNAFTTNSAGHAGGAISATRCGPVITRNIFTSNSGGDRGGAIYLYDLLTAPHTYWTADIINNLFVENQVTGTGGGAIAAQSSSGSTIANIINNTFVENQAFALEQDDGNGGAVLALGSLGSTAVLTLVNNIFYKNKAHFSANTGNSVACLLSSSASLLFCSAFSEASDQCGYHYSGLSSGDGCYCALLQGNGSIFIDEQGADYRLDVTGPWYTPIDKGHNPAAVPYSLVPDIDLDGLPRNVNISTISDGSGGWWDMGAYEAQE